MNGKHNRGMGCKGTKALAVSAIMLLSVLGIAFSQTGIWAGSQTVVETPRSDAESTGAEWHGDSPSDWEDPSLVSCEMGCMKSVSEVTLIGRLPSPRFYAPAIWDGSHAYIFGGEDSIPVDLDQIARYDPQTRNTTIMNSTLPYAGGQMGIVWDGVHAYLFGGCRQGGSDSKDQILRYTLSSDTVSTMKAVLLSPRYSMAAVWDGNRALLFGGTDNRDLFDDISSYDPVLDEISHLSARLPGPRMDAVAVWDGSGVLIFGGQRSNLFLDEILRYDPATDTISLTSTRLPWGLAQASVAFDGEYVYLFGGQTTSGSTNNVLRYEPSTGIITILNATLPTPRHATSAVWAGNSALIFGGFPPNLDEILEFRIAVHLDVSILLRVAGEKWHDVEVRLYEEDREIASANVTRYPGNPDSQTVNVANVTLDPSRNYSAVVYYTPDDDPRNGREWGATPAWIILTCDSEEVARLHHTFNVKRPKTWEWRVDDLLSCLPPTWSVLLTGAHPCP